MKKRLLAAATVAALTAGFAAAAPAFATDPTFTVEPTTVDVGSAIFVQANTPCPRPAGVVDWQVNVYIEVGGVPLSGTYLGPDGTGVPGQWSGSVPVGDLTYGGPGAVYARCFSPSGAAAPIVYDPVPITVNRPPAFTAARLAASVGTPLDLQSVNPCPAPAGAPEWIGAVTFEQGSTTVFDGNFDIAPDGSWRAPAVVPPGLSPGTAEVSVDCHNATGLDGGAPVTYGGSTLVVLPPPVFKATAATLAFGNVALRHTSAVKAVAVSNSSSGTLTFAAVHVAGGAASDFHVVSDGCGGRTLSPDAQCIEKLTFAPTRTGTRTAALVFADNAPGAPHSIALTGRGCSLLAFGTLCI